MEKLKRKERQELLEQIRKNYNCDVSSLQNFNFYKTAKNKIHISSITSQILRQIKRVQSLGIYFAKIEKKNAIRLSIEGTQLIVPKENVAHIKAESLSEYLSAQNLEWEDFKEICKNNSTQFIIVNFKGTNLGSALFKDDEVINYIPKSRKMPKDKLF